MVQDGSASSQCLVRTTLAVETKAAEGERALEFVISTPSVDRMGDTIAVDGWKLDSYKQNPVVLWAHDGTTLPIARATNIWTEGGSLRARAEFAPAELSPLGDKVLRYYQAGFLNAVSVGFMPLKWDFAKSKDRPFGLDFQEQELLEFSAVSVPANGEALAQRVAVEADDELVDDLVAAARAGEGMLTYGMGKFTFAPRNAAEAKKWSAYLDSLHGATAAETCRALLPQIMAAAKSGVTPPVKDTDNGFERTINWLPAKTVQDNGEPGIVRWLCDGTFFATKEEAVAHAASLLAPKVAPPSITIARKRLELERLRF